MAVSERLISVLLESQRLGFLGPRPIDEAVAHSEQFVGALGRLPAGSRLLDLGSGGGLPGLVLAEAYPSVSVVLVDRRQKRTDHLERSVRRLGLDNVSVWCLDVDAVIRDIEVGTREAFDTVTARGFGPPEVTLQTAVACCVEGGRMAISEPPSGDRWEPEFLAGLAVTLERHGSIAVFQRRPMGD